VSKFLGKFRKNQNYSDDYNAERQNGNKIGRVNEHKEIKKVLCRDLVEETVVDYEFTDIEDAKYQ
jgi:hypothetical protein